VLIPGEWSSRRFLPKKEGKNSGGKKKNRLQKRGKRVKGNNGVDRRSSYVIRKGEPVSGGAIIGVTTLPCLTRPVGRKLGTNNGMYARSVRKQSRNSAVWSGVQFSSSKSPLCLGKPVYNESAYSWYTGLSPPPPKPGDLSWAGRNEEKKKKKGRGNSTKTLKIREPQHQGGSLGFPLQRRSTPRRF